MAKNWNLLPLPPDFLAFLEGLEAAYLQSQDPVVQSGFGGGDERWQAERGPIIEAVDGDGTFIDIGCAVGHLLECLIEWSRERGYKLIPYGLDLGSRLIESAQSRFPQYPGHFWVGNAYGWEPPQTFDYVYSLSHNVPPDYLETYVRYLLDRVVTPGGKLIIGDYGSVSRKIVPKNLGEIFAGFGLEVAGEAAGGEGPITRFAWIQKPKTN